MASSILGRKVFPAAAAALTANVASSNGISSLLDGKFDGGWINSSRSSSLCEVMKSNASGKSNKTNENMFLLRESGISEKVLRKRMTSIGRFSMKSESEDNLSIPTFFLALSGNKNSNEDESGPSSVYSAVSNSRNKFTVSDFEHEWLDKDMSKRHPRFHSTVSQHDDRYFEEVHHIKPDDEDYPKIKAELDRHASETIHFSVYRDDLRNRLEHMLTSPIEVQDKLWEVKISNGPLGSSGAISKAKADAILQRMKYDKGLSRRNTKGDEVQRKKYGAEKLWSDAAQKGAPMESVLLFRSHHALADGASIMAALSDLSDEAEEIREDIHKALQKWKRKGKHGSLFRRLLRRLVRYFKMCLWLSLGTLRAFIYQTYLQITTLRNPFDAVREHAEKKGILVTGRSVSWCDAAPLEEAKQICNAIGKANGANITINDLFVSCITAAVVRQLNEHQQRMASMAPQKHKTIARNINVVVPVHLRGGIVLPGESVGNRIGAFVTRVPGEMDTTHVGDEAIQCPTKRLLAVNKSLSFSKRSPAPLVSHYFAKFCSDYLPQSWTKTLFKRANANACVVVSNNKGLDKKMHISGMTVEAAHGFLPLPPGLPIGVVVQSYAGSLSLSVTAEKWAVPDGDRFLIWVMEEYERLRVAASVQN